MRWVRRIVVGIAILAAVFVGGGFLLPAAYHVERSVVIAAPSARIHLFVGDLERWPDWTPLLERDSTIRTTYGERTTGVGAHQSWVGDSGRGELTFTTCDPERGIVYDLVFDDAAVSVGQIRYEPIDDETRVTWMMDGDAGMNIIGRYLGMMMDSLVGPDFQRGLDQLALEAESLPVPVSSEMLEASRGEE